MSKSSAHVRFPWMGPLALACSLGVAAFAAGPFHQSGQVVSLDRLASAKAAWSDGDLAAAEKLARAVVASEPKRAAAHELLGRILLETSHPEEAREAFARALEIEPDHVPAICGLARALQRLGEIDRALALLARATSLRPSDPAVWRERAFAEARAGDPGAIATIQHALSLDPRQADLAALAADLPVGFSGDMLDLPRARQHELEYPGMPYRGVPGPPRPEQRLPVPGDELR